MLMAWAAAKRIVCDIPSGDILRIFNRTEVAIIRDMTPQTAISILHQYDKDKKAAELDREFGIGNIVHEKDNGENRLMVVKRLGVVNGKEKFCGIDKDGLYYADISCDRYTWTGATSGYYQFLESKEDAE